MSRYDASWSAEEIAADMACRQAGRDMRKLDGLLDPALNGAFARLSHKLARQIGDHNRPAPRAA